MQTLGEIKTGIKLEFGKSSPRLDAVMDDRITDELREICSDFGYWFLRIDPGFKIPPLFPITTYPAYGLTPWLDNGWFLTTAGVDYYPVAVASTGTPLVPATWGYCEASKLNWVKRYDPSGSFQTDLKVVGSNLFWSAPDTGRQVGCPYAAMLQRGVDGKTYIRLHPTPNDTFLMQCSFQLGVPPWVGSGDSRYNLMSTVYPKCIKYLAGIVTAEFFHDAKELAKYQRKLYGDTDYGNATTMVPNHGLVGKMKRDTELREIQDADELPYYQSMGEALGRGGSPGHSPGGLYYYGDPTY